MQYTKLNDRTNPRAAYRLATDLGEVRLIRSPHRPDILHAYDERLREVRVDGFTRFTDRGGELRGVR